jgi:autophagy-related protein 5
MNASANTTLFRRLVWEGSVPVEIRINPSQLPAESDRGLESYFVSTSYLLLVLQNC